MAGMSRSSPRGAQASDALSRVVSPHHRTRRTRTTARSAAGCPRGMYAVGAANGRPRHLLAAQPEEGDMAGYVSRPPPL